MTIDDVLKLAKQWGCSYGQARARIDETTKERRDRNREEIQKIRLEIDELNFIYACKHCGEKFRRSHGYSKDFCDMCKALGFGYEEEQARRAETKRILAEKGTRICINCGKEYVPGNRQQLKHCGARCAELYHRKMRDQREKKLRELERRLQELLSAG